MTAPATAAPAADRLVVTAAYVPRSDIAGQEQLAGPAPLKEWSWSHASPHAAPRTPEVDDIIFFATTTANARAKPGSWSAATFPTIRIARVTSTRLGDPGWATATLMEIRRIGDVPGVTLGDLAEALRRAAALPAGVPKLFPVQVPPWLSLLLP
ncbi:hypothetical protein [Streptomyces yangpuensis]|uniref:hypothetical protein n=1 Tax=Streptomyces yangpuensis TaxID=1648182 RepID=UPI00364ABB0B